MANVIRLDEYRIHTLLQEGYKRWRRHFTETIDAQCPLRRLPPCALGLLAEAGDADCMALYSLIIGFLGHGPSKTFETLKPQDQHRILDIQMLAADYIRFEIMVRLKWLEAFEGTRYSLFEMVTRFEEIKKASYTNPPRLSACHPGYDEYKSLFERDRQVFIRRLLSPALVEFKRTFDLKT